MSNEILTKLLLDYDKKKQKAELDLEQRKQELFEKIPRLQEIENDLNMFAINTAKNILNGNSSSLDSLNSKVNILKSEHFVVCFFYKKGILFYFYFNTYRFLLLLSTSFMFISIYY